MMLLRLALRRSSASCRRIIIRLLVGFSAASSPVADAASKAFPGVRWLPRGAMCMDMMR